MSNRIKYGKSIQSVLHDKNKLTYYVRLNKILMDFLVLKPHAILDA